MTPSHPQSYLVSAIVSTYNAERFMQGKLEDLEAQSIAEQLEIIVIDSGSQQHERRIVEQFQVRYPNVRYIRTEQRETIYQAWNRGIKMATGEFICNANTDDRLRRDALEVLVRCLQENPQAVLAYADILYTTKENARWTDAELSDFRRFPEYRPFSLLEGCNIQTAPLWRRSLHDRFGYFDERYRSAADYEYWLKVSETNAMLRVNQYLVLCLQDPDSVSRSQLAVYEFLQIQQEYLRRYAVLLPRAQGDAVEEWRMVQEVLAQPLSPAARRDFLRSFPEVAQAHHLLGEHYFKANDVAATLRHFIKAFMLDPFCQTYQDCLAGFLKMQFVPQLLRYGLAAAADPSDLERRLCAGMLCQLLGRFEQAEVYYRQAALIAPESILPRANLQALEQTARAVDC
ncbi:MAG: glycosyltransferase [Trichlorobacter sp.]|jgi:glycosyltransferase involved in cell wall biosynthesis